MDLKKLIELYRGVTVRIVTTNPTYPIAVGEVLDGPMLSNILAIKLTAQYDDSPIGAVVYFNPEQIVSIS